MGGPFDLTVDGASSGFLPPCYPRLVSLRENIIPLYHEEHGRRHPLSAYTKTLNRVETAFWDVLNAFDELRAAKGLVGKASAMLDDYRGLYYALAEHFEACEGAAASLVKKGQESKHGNLRPFWNKSLDYKHVDRVINEVKHRHNEFVPISMEGSFFVVYGFLVAGIRSATCVGPNQNIHKEWNNMDTAFSFNRDLRRLFVDVFRVGSYLSDALERFNVPPNAAPEPVMGSRIFNIASRIAGIPNFCFPDEWHMPSQIVSIIGGGDAKTLRIASADDHKPLPPCGAFSVKTMITLGFEPSFRMPYFQRRRM